MKEKLNAEYIYDENGPTFEEIFLAIVDSHIEKLLEKHYDSNRANATITNVRCSSVHLQPE